MTADLTTSQTAPQGLLCPACRVNLVMTSREGVEIDYCPNCRGVWLDRGELDKIIERSVDTQGSAAEARPASPNPSPGYASADERYYEDRYRSDKHGGGHGGGHGRGGHGSFLKRLFD